METVKLKAKTKDYIWGGKRLFNYGKVSDTDIIAESWELSFFKDMESLIDSGKDIGKKLSDIANEKDLGKNVQKYPFFPVLIKLIDANDNLSVQVHPSVFPSKSQCRYSGALLFSGLTTIGKPKGSRSMTASRSSASATTVLALFFCSSLLTFPFS